MSLYDDVVNLSKPYLGIATEKFIERQCKSHLNINPQDMKKDNLPELAKWINVSGSLVMGADKAKELEGKVLKL